MTLVRASATRLSSSSLVSPLVFIFNFSCDAMPPIYLLRHCNQSRIIMNEPAPGVKANLLDSLRSIPPACVSQGPAEKVRLYFLLAWFHAVVQERLRYVPLGWSKAYDFNDSDMASAFTTIDIWLYSVVKGRANVDLAQIPWNAVRTLIKQSVYGGRIDSDFDQRILDAFVDGLFRPVPITSTSTWCLTPRVPSCWTDRAH